ncbi:hypothetical protein LTR10_023285 [Elasticomyces elasticus]|nr:hypothetical protein LTR10_023285 [Elasticomyces elasticus]KAK5023089.1 hypothetical protein LTS07_009582 [Exophiala sideris]KAK5178252.1 hypothetical protein LTR44_009336 [Eurotiomycetes sp. CCFEE 6388]
MTTPRQTISGEMPAFMPAALAVPSYSTRSRSLPTANESQGRRGSAIANAIGLRKKNEIDIALDGPGEFVHSYSTYDEIKGRVNIKFDKDTDFGDLHIAFEGQSMTYVEKIVTTAPTTGRTTGKHVFLRVQQPIEAWLLPEDDIFRAGVTYSIPFTFVVPDRLLPFICSHKVENEEIRKEHVQLPPSLGDPSIAGDGYTLMDDMAPDMAKISYNIRARITKWTTTGKMLELAEKSERIRIVPARDEAPPIRIDEESSDHVLRKEKSVRKGLFKVGKTGRLTVETTQPKSLRLPHHQKRQTEPVSSMATINLRFDPLTPQDVPPQLDSISSKLRAYTYYGATPYKAMPEPQKQDSWSVLHGVYPENIQLSSRNLSTVPWTRHDPSRESFSSSDLSRRPSSYSTSSTTSIPEPSSLYQQGMPFYTASVVVPIALPTKGKVFVPTFHTCIISRTYSVDLNLSFRSAGANVASSHIVLKTPIQVSAEGGIPPARIEESDAVLAAEIEQQFGLYEARMGEQAASGFGGESPVYEETAPNMPLLASGTRHMSLAQTMHAGHDAATPPPGYYSARDRLPGGPRTQSVSVFGLA